MMPQPNLHDAVTVQNCGKASRGSSARLLGRAAVWGIAALLLTATAWAQQSTNDKSPVKGKRSPKDPFPGKKQKAPSLDGGLGWLNTAGPIQLSKLKGKIVLLDFWTYCCINCMHILPDLARLEAEFPNELVVIGVHSAKFTGEKDEQNIRDAILRYGIRHPVVNDAKMAIWRRYGVRAWPTRVIIDPEGNVVGSLSGEGQAEVFRNVIRRLIEYHRAKGTLDTSPVHFQLEEYGRERTPLRYPGKLAVDVEQNTLCISDSSHNRLVIANLDSGNVRHVIGDGVAELRDGPFEKTRFNDPQGLALDGEILYVADTKNHAIRRVDLRAKKVQTLAGTGSQGYERRRSGPARRMSLASPWALLLLKKQLIIAMAGTHQIWRLDLASGKIGPYAGSGREDIINGQAGEAAFAQPSGLTTDGRWIYVADSEVSAIRRIRISDRKVQTVVGHGLFVFGDVDGNAMRARLQHALGIAYHQGQLYVADTYNNKIKVIDPQTSLSRTFLGDGKPGDSDEPPRFDEPGGLAVASGTLYVADTNNHKVRLIDLETKTVRTLELKGLKAPDTAEPALAPEPGSPTPQAAVALKSSRVLLVRGTIPVPEGHKLNPQAPMSFRVEGLDGTGRSTELGRGRIRPVRPDFNFEVTGLDLAQSQRLRITVTSYPCETGGAGVCHVQVHSWLVPISIDPTGGTDTIELRQQP